MPLHVLDSTFTCLCMSVYNALALVRAVHSLLGILLLLLSAAAKLKDAGCGRSSGLHECAGRPSRHIASLRMTQGTLPPTPACFPLAPLAVQADQQSSLHLS